MKQRNPLKNTGSYEEFKNKEKERKYSNLKKKRNNELKNSRALVVTPPPLRINQHLPDLIIITIFKFINDEIAFIVIPLVCKRFSRLFKLGVTIFDESPGIPMIKRQCAKCFHWVQNIKNGNKEIDKYDPNGKDEILQAKKKENLLKVEKMEKKLYNTFRKFQMLSKVFHGKKENTFFVCKFCKLTCKCCRSWICDKNCSRTCRDCGDLICYGCIIKCRYGVHYFCKNCKHDHDCLDLKVYQFIGVTDSDSDD